MTDTAISSLRRRMIEDMRIRGFTAETQTGYLRAVRDFAIFLGRPPDQAGAEELRRYQLHMRANGASATTMNKAVSGLRFFLTVTLVTDIGGADRSGLIANRGCPRQLTPIG